MGKTGIITCSVNVRVFLTGVSKAGHSWVQTSFKQKTNNQTKQMSASHFLLHERFNFKETVEIKIKSWYQASRLRAKLAPTKREVRFIILFKGCNLTRTKLSSFGTKTLPEFVTVLQTLYSESCNEKSFSAKSRKWSSHQMCVKTRFSSSVWAIKT